MKAASRIRACVIDGKPKTFYILTSLSISIVRNIRGKRNAYSEDRVTISFDVLEFEQKPQV